MITILCPYVSELDSLSAAASFLVKQALTMWTSIVAKMRTSCPGDSQQVKYQQSIEFLRAQHQELVGCLHEEIERLKHKNRGLALKAFFVPLCIISLYSRFCGILSCLRLSTFIKSTTAVIICLTCASCSVLYSIQISCALTYCNFIYFELVYLLINLFCHTCTGAADSCHYAMDGDSQIWLYRQKIDSTRSLIWMI